MKGQSEREGGGFTMVLITCLDTPYASCHPPCRSSGALTNGSTGQAQTYTHTTHCSSGDTRKLAGISLRIYPSRTRIDVSITATPALRACARERACVFAGLLHKESTRQQRKAWEFMRKNGGGRMKRMLWMQSKMDSGWRKGSSTDLVMQRKDAKWVKEI